MRQIRKHFFDFTLWRAAVYAAGYETTRRYSCETGEVSMYDAFNKNDEFVGHFSFEESSGSLWVEE